VADGDKAKDYIMGNEDVLKKLMNYMVRFTDITFEHYLCGARFAKI